MVYFQPQNFINQALPANRSRPVEVLYNGSGIHLITGPVPLVDISKSANRNSAGAIESYTVKIDIDGKIVRTGVDGDVVQNGSGIAPVLAGVKELKDFFDQSGDFGVFEIVCPAIDNLPAVIYSATGVKVLDIVFNRSDDNWIYTCDYNISMEYYESSVDAGGYFVQNTSDSWTVEPVEDYMYSFFINEVNQKRETHNPQLLPQPASQDDPQPSNFATEKSANALLSVVNIPQYRISRRVSAVGLPSGTGIQAANSAYFNAKKWVEDRLATAFNSNQIGSGLANFNYTEETEETRGVELYNHLRNTNFSVSDATYEVNDTWIAMPTGISYVEDYSIDCSTDDRFIKTVRIQGQIRGLSVSNIPTMSGEASRQIIDNSGRINTSGSMLGLSQDLDTKYQIPDNRLLNNHIISKNNTIYPNKYQNAASGWLNDIKPYLYRRACFATNSSDRNRHYVDKVRPNLLVGNPIYSYEPLLNINPVSTTEGLDPRKGTISYSVEYNNKLTLITGIITENINISDTGPTDVFGESFIIGRRLGPILQSLNAKTSTRKDISIDVTVLPPSSIEGMIMTQKDCPLYTGGSIYHQIQTIIEGFKPFGQRIAAFGNIHRDQQPGQVYVSQDNQNWSPAEGRYSRNVSWVYQQCDNSKNYLDH